MHLYQLRWWLREGHDLVIRVSTHLVCRQGQAITRMLKEQSKDVTVGVEAPMGLGDLVQKAVYLGIGMASYAGEKASEKLGELRVQVQKLADEMVERGEMNAEEARRFVDEMVSKAQQPTVQSPEPPRPTEPRQIEILDDDEPSSGNPPATGTTTDIDEMRRRVMELQDELRRLQND